MARRIVLSLTYIHHQQLQFCSLKTLVEQTNRSASLSSCSLTGHNFIVRKMSSSGNLSVEQNHKDCSLEKSQDRTYQEAIRKLNGLQSNFSVLKHIRQNSPLPAEVILKSCIRDLGRTGLSLDQLDSLNVIHVAGTKGKGSTCAFVESILRQAGFRTGFFSSPHLITARERIKINGKPLSEEQFTKYFFTVYDKLLATRDNESDMPPYFKFLTNMAFYTLFKENVDVAIIEVGIGGAGDSTNIVRKPIVTGITTLGLEHQFILGHTLEEIALAKAGIMKKDVPCFTVNNHPLNILEILRKHSENVSCPLYICPHIDTYEENVELSIDDGYASKLNASLAVQIVNAFVSRIKYSNLSKDSQLNFSPDYGKPFQLNQIYKDGLKQCIWYGRYQIYRFNDQVTFYFDGAHTEDSLELARNWFFNHAKRSYRILIFYITGDRDAEKLLKPFALSKLQTFDLVIFSPLTVNSSGRSSPSADTWSALGANVDVMKSCHFFDKIWRNESEACQSIVLNSVTDTIQFLSQISDLSTEHAAVNIEKLPNPQQQISILVTGSLYLVGTYLSVLDPNITVR